MSGAAAQASIPLDDLLTTINLAAEGLPASRVMTGLANALKSLNKPSKDSAVAFADFFAAIRDGTGGITSFRRVLEELESTGIINDPQQFRRLFPDERGARAILQAYLKAGEGLEEFDNRFKIVSADATAFNEAAEFALNTVRRHFVSLGSAIVSIGDDFLEKFKEPIISGLDAVVAGIGRVADRVRGISPETVQGFTENVLEFIGSIPDRAARVLTVLTDIKDLIVEGAVAVKGFADEFFNLSEIVSQLARGDLQSAFDTFLGSEAVQKVQGFFRSFVTAAEDAFGRIKTIGSAAFGAITDSLKASFDNSILLRLGSSAIGGSEALGADPAELLLQTAFGVNPVQAGASRLSQTATGGGIGFGTGAAIGAGIGSILPGAGTLAGAGIGGSIAAVSGALIGWFKATDETRAKQEAISAGLTSLRNTIRKQVEEAKRNAELTAAINSSLSDVAGPQNRALAIQRRALQIEADRADKVSRLRKQEQELLVEREDALRRINAFEVEHSGTVQQIIDARISQRIATEIAAAEENRAVEITKRTNVIRARIETRMRAVDARIKTLESELSTLSGVGPRDAFTRGAGSGDPRFLRVPGGGGEPLGGGISTRALFGTSRFTDLVGGKEESSLIKAIESLIEALKDNTRAEEAVKEALRPFNLDENLAGLSTRARISIRRSKERRQEEQASFINRRFESTGFGELGDFGDTGIFGFGDRGRFGAFDPSVRSALFGGPLGFRTSLPGEGRRVDSPFVDAVRGSTATFGGSPLFGFGGARSESAFPLGLFGGGGGSGFLGHFLSSIRDDSLGLLRPTGTSGDSGRGGLINIAELLSGATGLRGRLRGRRDPFSGGGDVSALKEAIKSIADAAFAGPGAPTAGREIVARLTSDVADTLKESGKDTRSQTRILEGVLEELRQLVREDKETKKRISEDDERSEKIREAEEKLSVARDEKSRLDEAVSGAADRAAEGVKTVDPDAITKKIIEEETATLDELLGPLDAINEQIKDLRDEISDTNERAVEEITKAQAEFLELFGQTSNALGEFSELALKTFNESNEIGRQFLAIAEKLREQQTAALKNFTDLAAQVKRLRAKLDNKNQ